MEGNSTESSVGQSPLPEFGWVNDSLSEGFPQSVAGYSSACLSRDIAAAERERCNSLLRLKLPASWGLRRSLALATGI